MTPARCSGSAGRPACVSSSSAARTARRRGSATEVYDAGAAERTLLLRADTRTALERLDVAVLDEEPDVLPVALVDHYLLLKSRGLL